MVWILAEDDVQFTGSFRLVTVVEIDLREFVAGVG